MAILEFKYICSDLWGVWNIFSGRKIGSICYRTFCPDVPFLVAKELAEISTFIERTYPSGHER